MFNKSACVLLDISEHSWNEKREECVSHQVSLALLVASRFVEVSLLGPLRGLRFLHFSESRCRLYRHRYFEMHSHIRCFSVVQGSQLATRLYPYHFRLCDFVRTFLPVQVRLVLFLLGYG